MQQWLALVGSTLMVWPLWTLIHEISHILVANEIAPVKDIKFWLYPHIDEEGKFYFARVRWSWNPWPIVSDFTLAMVYLAPRIPDLFATLMFPYGILFSSPWKYIWYILWGGGLVDMFIGSLGIRKHSDLQISSKLLKIDPKIIRVISLVIIMTSIIMAVTAAY